MERRDSSTHDEAHSQIIRRPVFPSPTKSPQPVTVSRSSSEEIQRFLPVNNTVPRPWKRASDGVPKTKVACLLCRSKKQKCDGARPICGQCQTGGYGCSYDKVPDADDWVMRLSEERAQQRPRTSKGPAGEDATPRTKIACLLCRSKKQRCDGLQPECERCLRNGYQCAYDKTARTIDFRLPKNDEEDGFPERPPYVPSEDDVARRAKVACLVCRLKKQRCDGTRPVCERCLKGGYDCSYDRISRQSEPVIFERNRREFSTASSSVSPVREAPQITPQGDLETDAASPMETHETSADQTSHHTMESDRPRRQGGNDSDATWRAVRTPTMCKLTDLYGIPSRFAPHRESYEGGKARASVSSLLARVLEHRGSDVQGSFEALFMAFKGAFLNIFPVLRIETFFNKAISRLAFSSHVANSLDVVLCQITALGILTSKRPASMSFIDVTREAEELTREANSLLPLLLLQTHQAPSYGSLMADVITSWILKTMIELMTSAAEVAWFSSCTAVDLAEALVAEDTRPADCEDYSVGSLFWTARFLNTTIALELGKVPRDFGRDDTQHSLARRGISLEAPATSLLSLFASIETTLDCAGQGAATLADLDTSYKKVLAFDSPRLSARLWRGLFGMHLYRRIRLLGVTSYETDRSILRIGEDGLAAVEEILEVRQQPSSGDACWHMPRFLYDFLCLALFVGNTTSLRMVPRTQAAMQRVSAWFLSPISQQEIRFSTGLVKRLAAQKLAHGAILRSAVLDRPELASRSRDLLQLDGDTNTMGEGAKNDAADGEIQWDLRPNELVPMIQLHRTA